jgi:hypothetical protein
MNDIANQENYAAVMNQLKTSELSEAEKVARAFAWVTDRILEHTQHEIEIARAIHDSETTLKHQVKLETVKHVRNILQQCYQAVLGRNMWDE